SDSLLRTARHLERGVHEGRPAGELRALAQTLARQALELGDLLDGDLSLVLPDEVPDTVPEEWLRG
ncbi:hypothetical protein, partial [Nocardioides sp. GY 10127]|uniref:hypothetical protein n=1 Tax=Nocardioides sp. GY 10127 TaxID=2569762 RepID=UPI001457EAB7